MLCSAVCRQPVSWLSSPSPAPISPAAQLQFSFAPRRSWYASHGPALTASISPLPRPISSSVPLLFSCAQPGSVGAYSFGSAQGPAFRLLNQAAAGCRLSCPRHSASSAGIRSMRLRARMCRLFFDLWACISVLLIRSYRGTRVTEPIITQWDRPHGVSCLPGRRRLRGSGMRESSAWPA
jgi:hypothetical protein